MVSPPNIPSCFPEHILLNHQSWGNEPISNYSSSIQKQLPPIESTVAHLNKMPTYLRSLSIPQYVGVFGGQPRRITRMSGRKMTNTSCWLDQVISPTFGGPTTYLQQLNQFIQTPSSKQTSGKPTMKVQ